MNDDKEEATPSETEGESREAEKRLREELRAEWLILGDRNRLPRKTSDGIPAFATPHEEPTPGLGGTAGDY